MGKLRDKILALIDDDELRDEVSSEIDEIESEVNSISSLIDSDEPRTLAQHSDNVDTAAGKLKDLAADLY